MKSFQGKVAAITGAGSGMGRALAISLANRGCEVALSDINSNNLDATAELIRDTGVKTTLYTLDVSQRTQVEAYASAVQADHGRVHMIFNNAGVSVTDTAEHMSWENFNWLMDINFWGVVYGTRAFLPYLQEVDEAHIINTSSIFGTIAVPGQSAYNASKFAVRGYTYALRQELMDSHIRVSCVQPGGVKTNIINSSRYVATDNLAPTREEFATRFDSIAGLTSIQAANQILKGVKKNKVQILVGRDAKLIALLERLLPVGYQRLLGNLLKDD